MNILYLCEEYPPGQHGGIGTAVKLLARQVAKLGHTVIVAGLYTPGYGGPDEFADEGVKVYRFRWILDGKWFENRPSLRVRLTNRVLKSTGLMEWDIKKSLTAYQKNLERLIAEHQIDIIEMPDYNDYIRFCKTYIPFPKLSVPVIVKMHGTLTYIHQGKVAPHVLKMEQTILSQATAVAGVSKYMATQSAVYLSYPHAVGVLYNGISTQIPAGNIPKNPKQVVFTGTLTAAKGIYQLAKAWNLVNQQVPDARLLILGKGPQQKVMDHLTHDAAATVLFTGHVGTDVLHQHLAASAIGVFPSYSEAFSLAPLEAMVYSAAVIYTKRTSGPELIDDRVNGLLVDPENADEIAAAILYLLNDTEACNRLAINGNKKVKQHFEISNVAAQNIGFYKQVLSGIIK